MNSECVFVPLIIQHALRMRHVISSSLACLAVQNFPDYLMNVVIVWVKNLLKIKFVCVDFGINFCLKRLSF